MKIKGQLPVIVQVDNTGSIFMGRNITTTTSSRTKHVDVMKKYVCEYQEDSVVKIIFVRSDENTGGTMTKNIQGDLYGKHSSELVTPKN